MGGTICYIELCLRLPHHKKLGIEKRKRHYPGRASKLLAGRLGRFKCIGLGGLQNIFALPPETQAATTLWSFFFLPADLQKYSCYRIRY